MESIGAFAVVVVASAAPAHAAKVDRGLELMFVPQQAVAGATVQLAPEMTEQAVALRVVDGRRGHEPSWVGTRTDDDDRPHELHATADIVRFVAESLTRLAHDWGLNVSPEATRVLEITLMSFQVLETNQAVGATFTAESRLGLAFLDAAGRRLWNGSASGDATRYGRAGSNANCNEVLSDALLEAFADGLGQRGLQEAWSGRGTAPAEGAVAASSGALQALTPDQLLDQLATLLDRGFQTATLLEFVQGKALTEALSADDLARWKERGVPEEVIRAALGRPVR